MEISPHAIARYQQRIDAVTADQAAQLILDIVERGHEPTKEDWPLFSVTPEACKRYLIAYRIMVVVDTAKDSVLTVLAPKRIKTHKIPQLRELRGLAVRDALARFYLEDRR